MSDPTPQDEPLALPRRTTPTWEMELLLSGATVFTMFQATQAVTAWGGHLLPRLADNLRMFVSVLFTYGNGALTLLSLAFLLHLSLRAYWVALVGIDSVYPAGPRFDRLRIGPIQRGLVQQRWRPIGERIEAADNAATIVFALGISLAFLLVPISAVVTVLYAIAVAIAWLADAPHLTSALFGLLSGVLFLPLWLAGSLDRRRGERLAPGGWAHRACAAVLGVYARAGMGRDANPMVAVFSTNIGERKGAVVVFIAIFGAMIGSTALLAASRNQLGVGSYADFPSPRRGMADSLDGRNYASMQEPGQLPSTPFLPSPTARGDYVLLVVPYVPMLHGGHFADCGREAPAADDAAGERERRRVLLACVAAGFTLTLDDAPLSAEPQWYADPKRDLRGLAWMVPVAALAPGRHELAVQPPPERDEGAAKDEDEAAEPELPWVIPFWR